MLSLNDVNHCQCPEHANYDVVANQFNDIDDDIESMETTYVCSPVTHCFVRYLILRLNKAVAVSLTQWTSHHFLIR